MTSAQRPGLRMWRDEMTENHNNEQKISIWKHPLLLIFIVFGLLFVFTYMMSPFQNCLRYFQENNTSLIPVQICLSYKAPW